jgi:hypothetical protein
MLVLASPCSLKRLDRQEFVAFWCLSAMYVQNFPLWYVFGMGSILGGTRESRSAVQPPTGLPFLVFTGK